MRCYCGRTLDGRCGVCEHPDYVAVGDYSKQKKTYVAPSIESRHAREICNVCNSVGLFHCSDPVRCGETTCSESFGGSDFEGDAP